MPATASVQRRRRLLLVIAGLLVSVDVAGSILAGAVTARATLAQRGPLSMVPVAQLLAYPAPTEHPASIWQRLAAELPLSTPDAGSRTRSRITSDEAFDLRVQAAPPAPVAAESAPLPPPAPAGDEAAAAGSEPAGASQPAAAVTPRLRIPDLGINRTIRGFPCDRAAPPQNYVYRWGCSGRNNLYLLGHAETVFRALHDAYAAGRLRVGMRAQYTDSGGRTISYRVTSWRVVRPDQVSWAIASQPVPSMTLQTCYGAKSEYRLLVRLVAS
ncbi:MAG TPA: sortase [Nonomuraea sp.]|nr:sortase [Nonomuraea sp.]